MELEKILQNTATDRYGERDTRYLALVDQMTQLRESGERLTGLYFVLDKIPQGASILEFGPASGYMTRYLKEQLDCKVTIVELDPECAESASKYAVDCFVGSAEDSSWSDWLGDRQFDAILFCDVLEHLRSPWDTLKWSTSHLKDEGSIFCSIPNVAHHTVIAHLLENEFEYFSCGLLDITHIRFFTARSVKNMMDYCNLSVEAEGNTQLSEMDAASPYPWIAAAAIPWIAELQQELTSLPQYTIFQYVIELKKRIPGISRLELDICRDECFDYELPFSKKLRQCKEEISMKNEEVDRLLGEKEAILSSLEYTEAQLELASQSCKDMEMRLNSLLQARGTHQWNRMVKFFALFLILPRWRRHFRNRNSIK